VKWLALMVVVVAVGLSLAVWPGGMLAPKAQPDREPVASGPQHSSPRRREIQGIGYVEPATEVWRLVFKIDGVIETCAVEVGRRVKRGDLLMSLANREEAAAVAAPFRPSSHGRRCGVGLLRSGRCDPWDTQSNPTAGVGTPKGTFLSACNNRPDHFIDVTKKHC